MSIDAIQAIGQTLAPLSPLSKADPVAVHPSAQQQFAALLNASPITPAGALAVQNVQQEVSELTFGAELTAKLAGSVAQSINKLVNLS
jgi:type III secretion system YscI/HrpB-like protein